MQLILLETIVIFNLNISENLYKKSDLLIVDSFVIRCNNNSYDLSLVIMANVAQSVRASGCGSEGRRFDPGHSPQLKKQEIVASSAYINLMMLI